MLPISTRYDLILLSQSYLETKTRAKKNHIVKGSWLFSLREGVFESSFHVHTNNYSNTNDPEIARISDYKAIAMAEFSEY